MKKFILKISFFFGIPIILLMGIYYISDPFKTIKPFSLKEFSIVNRDYLSTELYLKNRKKYNYNSFIFGSSRGGGVNTYQMRSYLPKGSQPFLFQAWGETITGIYQKIKYLDENHVSINNVIILLDIPGSFNETQEPKTALGIKHYLFSGKPKFYYQSILFYSFLKPSEIFKSTKEIFFPTTYDINFDTISNDWFKRNKFNWMHKPLQNKELNKDKFKPRYKREIFSSQVIKSEYVSILQNIDIILKKHKTDYKIVITPDYNQLHINDIDMFILQKTFGKKNVYNYSGKNSITEDKYNFMDINHFDAIVGWQIINDIYQKDSLTNLK